MNKSIVIGVLVAMLVIGVGIFFWTKDTVPADGQLVATTTTTTTTTTTNPPVTAKADAPNVETNASVVASNSTAIVNGQVTPNGAQTTYWYEYGPTTALGTRTTTQALGSGFSRITTPGYITGLKANTQYYFRLSASNRLGTVNGTMYNFTTNTNPPPQGIAPTTRTSVAGDVARTTANLNGQINPNKSQTTYWFEYGEDSTLGGVSILQSAGDGSVLMPVSVALSNLKPLTKYYFRLNAQNQYGTVNGAITNFTTKGPSAPGLPSADTTSVNVMGTSTATLRGNINPNGVETTYWFEYSTDSLLGSIAGTVSPSQSLDADTVTVAVKLDVGSLTRNTKYYYRLVGQNQYGTVHGDIVSFKTK